MPGIGELVIILVIILIVFGAGKLPQIGDALGRSIRNFKRSSSGSDEVEVGPKAKEIQGGEDRRALGDQPSEVKEAKEAKETKETKETEEAKEAKETESGASEAGEKTPETK
jgi:sec-independent protein translocase protein TatA